MNEKISVKTDQVGEQPVPTRWKLLKNNSVIIGIFYVKEEKLDPFLRNSLVNSVISRQDLMVVFLHINVLNINDFFYCTWLLSILNFNISVFLTCFIFPSYIFYFMLNAHPSKSTRESINHQSKQVLNTYPLIW